MLKNFKESQDMMEEERRGCRTTFLWGIINGVVVWMRMPPSSPSHSLNPASTTSSPHRFVQLLAWFPIDELLGSVGSCGLGGGGVSTLVKFQDFKSLCSILGSLPPADVSGYKALSNCSSTMPAYMPLSSPPWWLNDWVSETVSELSIKYFLL